MKILWAFIAVMLATEVGARCVDGALQGKGPVLHARYQVFSDLGRHQVNVYRAGNQVAWQRGEVINVWKKEAERASLLRSFPDYERSIGYPAGDLRALGKERPWQAVAGWPEPAEAGFYRAKGGGAVVLGCPAQAYHNEGREHVLWLELAGLPARVAYADQQWQLMSLRRASMEETFDQWRRWPSTDFADVGDKESDPLLRKMVVLGSEQGAVDLYPADGQPVLAEPLP